jgi:Leucine-rich repeat (LRR) protein
MNAGLTVDSAWAAIRGHALLARMMQSLPLSIATIGFRTKMAEATVADDKFSKEAFARMPEGHFKYLIRKAYFQKNHQAIDEFLIEKVIGRLATERPDLFFCGLTDVSWLSDELYILNKQKPIQAITLSCNLLTQLPAHFLDNCTQLQVLNLDDNKLTQLPDNFLEYCTQLKEVYLQSNKLTQLPENFLDHCTQLKEVYFRSIKLTQLPAHFLDNCTQLQEVNLDDNKLTQLPDNFLDHCTQLKWVWLNNNQLTQLSANFLDRCTQLQKVWLHSNQLTQLPNHFLDHCTQLKEVYLHNCQLTQLPENFLDHCTQLQKVDLSQNPWTTQRPDDLVAALRARTPPVDVQYENKEYWRLRALYDGGYDVTGTTGFAPYFVPLALRRATPDTHHERGFMHIGLQNWYANGVKPAACHSVR